MGVEDARAPVSIYVDAGIPEDLLVNTHKKFRTSVSSHER